MLRFSSVRVLLLSATCFYLIISLYTQSTTTIYTQTTPTLLAPAASPIAEQPLVNFVKKTVTTLRHTAYKLGGTRFDAIRGIYIIDCSAYVDRLLRTVFPRAYQSLVNAIGTKIPNSKNYYDFFMGLSHISNPYWSKVDSVSQLHPGDILVFCKKNIARARAAGHVMVIMSKPIPCAEGGFSVQVADSAPFAHSQDTRSAQHGGGIGIGTLMLKADPQTGKPAAYAWKEGSAWNSSVKFAMARPIENKAFV